MTRRRLESVLAAAIVAGVAGLGVAIYARMSGLSERARLEGQLEQRLAAARRVIARDVRQDGYGLAPFEPVRGLPPFEEGVLAFTYADDDWGTEVAEPVPGAPAGAVPLDRAGGLAKGDWIVVGALEGGCVGRVATIVDREPAAEWVETELPLACEPKVGRPVARIGHRRYKLAGEALQVADGVDGAWRGLADGVEVMNLAPVAGAGRGALHRLTVAGHAADDRGRRATRTVDGLVLAPNQVDR